MSFKRLFMPMLVLGIIFGLGSMAFGATAITCGLSTPLNSTARATATGHTEPIGAGSPSGTTGNPTTDGGGTLRVVCNNTGTAGGATDPGVVVLTISFGVPVTNTTTHPQAGTGIRLAAQTGDFVVGNVGIAAVNNNAGTIVIGLGTPTASSTVSPTTGITFNPGVSSFDILGILVSTNGKSGAITASLTSTGGITVGNAGSNSAASLNVIDSILPGLQDPTVPASLPGLPFFTGVSGGAAILNSSGTAVKGNFVIRIQENYQDMFREAQQFNGPNTTGNFPQSPSSDVEVQIALSNIPSGLDISGCAVTITNLAGSATTGGTPSINFTNITSASPILTINFNSPVDLDNVDVLWVKCATVGVGSATLPLPSTPVTAQVTLAPTGLAVSTGIGNPPLTGLTTGQVPRYQQLLLPATPLTVVIFPASNTVLLMSFGFVGPGYNTGVAVANTTVDPFGPAGGGAAASSGTVSFLMVKNDGTSKTYVTTTGSPGSGLTGAGVVASGSTYVVNLSEILTAANFGTTFTGYVFITANFTNAHGAATIYTTSNGAAALSTPVLTLPAVSTAQTRATPDVGGGLGQ
jgi:hypothetical protein